MITYLILRICDNKSNSMVNQVIYQSNNNGNLEIAVFNAFVQIQY
jgi:hypothetical protein